MEDRTFESELSIQRIGLIALGLLLVVLLVLIGLYQLRTSDPYVRQVIFLEGNVEKGQAIFQMNCSGCHGLKADGHVGPSLHNVSSHRSQVGLIHQVTSGQTPPMPAFQASPQEMADLLSYLNTL